MQTTTAPQDRIKHKSPTNHPDSRISQSVPLLPLHQTHSNQSDAQEYTLSSIQNPSDSSKNDSNKYSISKILSRIKSVGRLEGQVDKEVVARFQKKQEHLQKNNFLKKIYKPYQPRQMRAQTNSTHPVNSPMHIANSTMHLVNSTSHLVNSTMHSRDSNQVTTFAAMRLKAELLQAKTQLEEKTRQVDTLLEDDVKYKAMMYDKIERIKNLQNQLRGYQREKKAQIKQKDLLIGELQRIIKEMQRHILPQLTTSRKIEHFFISNELSLAWEPRQNNHNNQRNNQNNYQNNHKHHQNNHNHQVAIIKKQSQEAIFKLKEEWMNQIQRLRCEWGEKESMLVGSIEELKHKSQQDMDHIKATQDHLHGVQDHLHGVQKQLRESQQKLHVSQEELGLVQDQLKATQNKLHLTQNKLHLTQNKLHLTQNKLHLTQNQLHLAQNQLHVVQDKLKIVQDNLKTAQDNLNVVQDSLKTAQDKLHAVNRRREQLQLSLVESKHNEQQAYNKVQSMQNTLGDNQNQYWNHIKQKEQQIATLQNQQQSLTTQLIQLYQQHQNKQQKLALQTVISQQIQSSGKCNHLQTSANYDQVGIQQSVARLQCQNKRLKQQLWLRQKNWIKNINIVSRSRDNECQKIKKEFMSKLHHYKQLLIKCKVNQGLMECGAKQGLMQCGVNQVPMQCEEKSHQQESDGLMGKHQEVIVEIQAENRQQ